MPNPEKGLHSPEKKPTSTSEKYELIDRKRESESIRREAAAITRDQIKDKQSLIRYLKEQGQPSMHALLESDKQKAEKLHKKMMRMNRRNKKAK